MYSKREGETTIGIHCILSYGLYIKHVLFFLLLNFPVPTFLKILLVANKRPQTIMFLFNRSLHLFPIFPAKVGHLH